MLAAEYQTLPGHIRNELAGFFASNETWLEKVLSDGRSAGSLSFSGTPGGAARMIVATLEGAMLIARPFGDVERLTAAADQLAENFTPQPGAG